MFCNKWYLLIIIHIYYNGSIIVLGCSSSYSCYGFGHATFQLTSKLESHNPSTSCILDLRYHYHVLSMRWVMAAGKSGDLLCENTQFTYFSSPTIGVCSLHFPNSHFKNLRLFIDHFRSLGLRNDHSFTMKKFRM